MFLYCITPYKKMKCNFIKVGVCENIELLKGRYMTYYGENCRYYYVKIRNKEEETQIHIKLKNLGLHIENELFLLNEEYDFYFYIQMLKKFEIYNSEDNFIKTTPGDDIYILKKNNMLDFIIEMYKNIIILENKIVNSIIITYDKKCDMEKLWKCYLNFCINNKKYYNTKSILKKNIQAMVYYDNPIKYKNYKIEFKMDEIIVTEFNNIKKKYTRCINKMILLFLYNYVKIKRENHEKIINYIFYDVNKEIDIISNIDISIFEDTKNNPIIKICKPDNLISKFDVKYHLKKGNTIINDNGKFYVKNKKQNISYVEDSYILQLLKNINNNYNHILNEIKINKKKNTINIIYKCMDIIEFTIDNFYNIPQEYVISKKRSIKKRCQEII